MLATLTPFDTACYALAAAILGFVAVHWLLFGRRP